MPVSARSGPPGPPAVIQVGDVTEGDAPALELVRVSRGIYRADIQLPRGPEGPAGPGSARIEFEQASPATEWVIDHHFGLVPSGVTVIDSAGSTVIGDISHPSVDRTVLQFSAPFSGKAVLSA